MMGLEDCYYEDWTRRTLSTALGVSVSGPKILREFELPAGVRRQAGRPAGSIEVDGHLEIDPETFLFVEAEVSRMDVSQNVLKLWRWTSASDSRRAVLIEAIGDVGWAQYAHKTSGRAQGLADQATAALGERFRVFFVVLKMCVTPPDDARLLEQLQPVRPALSALLEPRR